MSVYARVRYAVAALICRARGGHQWVFGDGAVTVIGEHGPTWNAYCARCGVQVWAHGRRW